MRSTDAQLADTLERAIAEHSLAIDDFNRAYGLLELRTRRLKRLRENALANQAAEERTRRLRQVK